NERDALHRARRHYQKSLIRKCDGGRRGECPHAGDPSQSQEGGVGMRWRFKNLSEWHRWFAWFPVRLDDVGVTVWLEYVERRFDACANRYYREVTAR